MPASFYTALVQQAERTLRYYLERYEYSCKYETQIHAARWIFRIAEADRKLAEARDAASRMAVAS